jgi:protein-tyrosine phosphatase
VTAASRSGPPAGSAAGSEHGARRIQICFVCHGNICRSPTAHGVMERLIADAGLAGAVAIDSAGTSAEHAGDLPDPRTCSAARRRGLELTHRARQFVVSDLDRFDLVIAMDGSNLKRLRALAGGRGGGRAGVPPPPIVLLRSFDPTADDGAEVSDPWYGGDAGFEEVLDQCERACAGLVAHLRKQLR